MTDQLMSLEKINEQIAEANTERLSPFYRKLLETARAAHEWKAEFEVSEEYLRHARVEIAEFKAQSERNEAAYKEAMEMSEKHRAAFSETLGRAMKAEQENEKLREQAAIAEAFMKKLSPGYSWNDCPTEYVTDLQNQVHELKEQLRAALSEERQRIADGIRLLRDAHKRGTNECETGCDFIIAWNDAIAIAEGRALGDAE